MHALDRLQKWYADQCDGDWEHSFCIRIDTLDNPGWTVSVDLIDTVLQDKPHAPIRRGDSETDAQWLYCKVDSGRFEAAGGVACLPDMLEQFLCWAGY